MDSNGLLYSCVAIMYIIHALLRHSGAVSQMLTHPSLACQYANIC